MAAIMQGGMFQINHRYRIIGVISEIVGIRTFANTKYFMFVVEQTDTNYLMMLSDYSPLLILKFHENQVIHVYNAVALQRTFIGENPMSPICFAIRDKLDIIFTNLYMGVGNNLQPIERKIEEIEADD